MDLNAYQRQSGLDASNASKLAMQSKGLKQLSDKKLEETAQEFESVFIQTSLKHMRPQESKGLFNAGMAESIFMDYLDEAIAKEISKSANNFGIADAVIQQNSLRDSYNE